MQHIRRYDWRTLLIGVTLSILMFIQHYVAPIISRPLTSKIPFIVANLAPNMDITPILANIWIVPIIVALFAFLIKARKGYALHGATHSPIYLSHSFREAIEFIREMKDTAQSNSGNVANIVEETTESNV